MKRLTWLTLATLSLLLFTACGDDDDENEANRLGVGASCDNNDHCATDQSCLTEFKGGYCGVRDCEHDEDCPEGSACIAGENATSDSGTSGNYCFLVCANKIDCNLHRPVDDEANCSSSVTFIDDAQGRKACVPPSGS
jgi:hypothetical protein